MSRKLVGRNKSPSIIVRFVVGSATLILVAFASFILVINISSEFRSRFFAFWFTLASQEPMLLEYRCGPVRSLSGRILEIGPGAGANFHCWNNSDHSITRWEGIEVNKYFEAPLKASHQNNRLNFPMHVHWINEDASNLNIESNAFDAVVMTHVLCSVPDVNAVLGTVARALKPGATLYYLEHVQAAEDQKSLLFWQQIMAPILSVVGNGCHFKDTGKYLELATSRGGVMAGYELNLTHFRAPMPLPPLSPHIAGTITKSTRN
jgi:SAM-dependent methyltransferase